MQAIPADKLWNFPVPGGHAYYYIESEDPLIITPIRYGSATRSTGRKLQEKIPRT